MISSAGSLARKASSSRSRPRVAMPRIAAPCRASRGSISAPAARCTSNVGSSSRSTSAISPRLSTCTRSEAMRWVYRPFFPEGQPAMPRPWTVTRHDPIEKIDENLWGVSGDVPGFPRTARFHRRMQIVKLSNGRLVFHNAVPLGDAALAEVRAWGKPSILIVPHHLHALDAFGFQAKLGLSVFTASPAVEKVRSIVKVDGTLDELPEDPALRCEPLKGTRFGEGFAGFMFRLLGVCGAEPRMAGAYKLRAVSDKAALKRDLLRLADTPGLVRMVPSHGEIVVRDPAGAIRRAAERA